MSAADAWQEWADAELEFGALGSFALEVRPAFLAGYRRALEDAADTATRELINIAGIRETVIDPDTLRARAAAADPRETKD